MPKIIDNIKYYTANELSIISEVHDRTLRRWLANGDLDGFLYKYREHATSIMLFRIQPPSPSDERFADSDIYRLPKTAYKQGGSA